jgi:hypothetical protein
MGHAIDRIRGDGEAIASAARVGGMRHAERSKHASERMRASSRANAKMEYRTVGAVPGERTGPCTGSRASRSSPVNRRDVARVVQDVESDARGSQSHSVIGMTGHSAVCDTPWREIEDVRRQGISKHEVVCPRIGHS